MKKLTKIEKIVLACKERESNVKDCNTCEFRSCNSINYVIKYNSAIDKLKEREEK